ncbi:MAG: HTTM domain-containing protein [Myxococcota bacterium]
MNALRAYWLEPIERIRVTTLVVFFYPVLALDVWLLMLPGAGRYGGFNVAHFAWLQNITGFVDTDLYNTLLIATGLFAWVSVTLRDQVWPRVVVLFCYTLAWSISRIDSYQHHYLVSWLLLYLVFMPTERSLWSADDDREPMWAFQLMRVTVGIVYGFTALAKSEPAWLDGSTLALIGTGSPAAFMISAVFGDPQLGWMLSAWGVFALQIALCIAYLWPRSHLRARPRLRWAVTVMVFVLAGSFHGTSDLLRLKIGWFSYYMIAITAVMWFPESWLRWPADKLSRLSLAGARRAIPTWIVIALAVGLVGVAFGWSVLPGVRWAVAAMLAVGVIVAALQSRSFPIDRAARVASMALVVACSAWLAVVSTTPLYFNYFRQLGVESAFRGNRQETIDYYERALSYSTLFADREGVQEAQEALAALGVR